MNIPTEAFQVSEYGGQLFYLLIIIMFFILIMSVCLKLLLELAVFLTSSSPDRRIAFPVIGSSSVANILLL